MDFLLDPCILAVPDQPATEQVALSYLCTLGNWAAAVNSRNHKFWLTSYIFQAVYDENQYPLPHHVRELVQGCGTNGEDVIDAETAMTACHHVLAIPPFLDDELIDGYELLVDELSTAVIPDDIARRLRRGVANALRRTLVEIAYAKQQHAQPLATRLLFATVPLDEQVDSVSVSTTFCLSGSGSEITIESDWALIVSPSALDEIDGTSAFWSDTDRATQWAYRHLRECGVLDPNLHKLIRHGVGDDFNPSIVRCRFDERPELLARLFRVIARVLSGQLPRGTRDNHELRTRRNGPQIMRKKDNATAWRARIMLGSLGWRLHYWLLPDQTIELSKVGPHDDFTIA